MLGLKKGHFGRFPKYEGMILMAPHDDLNLDYSAVYYDYVQITKILD